MQLSKLEEVHLVISGTVQGVSYRYFTQQEAQQLELVGWVKNLESGEVELLAQGKEQDIARLIQWCHTGSPQAIVTGVLVKKRSIISEFGFEKFTIQR